LKGGGGGGCFEGANGEFPQDGNHKTRRGGVIAKTGGGKGGLARRGASFS